MSWRKWFVRGLVFTIIGACAGVALIYQRFTNSTAVREQVVGKLQSMYPGALVTVDSARLRLLGSIVVNELRLARRDDPNNVEFVHVPSAILYHDKEKILDGQMMIRKVELNRPRLRVIREADGSWNLQGILGPSQPNVPLPTIVIHQGTLLFEDRMQAAGQAPIEINDIDISFINDPLPTVVVNGSAKSALLGALQAKGIIVRGKKDLTFNIKAKNMPLRTALLQRLNVVWPSKLLTETSLDARGDLDANVVYRGDQSIPLEYGARLQISKGKLQHPLIPMPLSDVHASLECVAGLVRIKDFKARSGEAVIEGQGSAQLPEPDQHFDASLALKNVTVDGDLAARLPEKIRILQQAFQATGATSLQVEVARRAGKWAPPATGSHSHVILAPENLSLCFVKFPYPLKQVSGTVTWDLESKRTQVDVTGYAQGQRPVILRGFWKGEGLQTEARFDLQAGDVPLEEKLISALTPKFQKLTNSFHPSGTIDVKSHLWRDAGSTDFFGEYHISLRDGAVCWDDFPYPLEKCSGILDVYPKHWELRDAKGSLQGAQVNIQAKSQSRKTDLGVEENDGLLVEIGTRNLLMDGQLQKALGRLPALARAWDTFQPSGRMNFAATIERWPAQPQDMDVTLEMSGCAIDPFFQYPLSDLSGKFRFHENRLDIKEVRARHDDARLELDQGTVDMRPGGGHYTDLRELRLLQLRADKAFIKAVPKQLQSCLESLDLKEPVDVKTRMIISQAPELGSQPEVWWDGQLLLKKASVTTGVPWKNISGTLACTGRHNGRQLQGLSGNFLLEQAELFKQPFKSVHGKFHIKDSTPEVLNLGLHAPIFGGDITGQARLEFTAMQRYELNLTASQVNLKDFGVHNLGPNSQLSGNAMARLHLTGLGSNVDTLDGNGSIDVPNGRLYNLPLLLDLLKFLGLRWPDRTAFEELHALFAIHGSRVTMRRLDLTGNAISLSGKGDFKLDGSELNLDFYPSWARVEQILPPVVRPIPPAISRNFLTIEMRGKVSEKPEDLKFHKKLMPLIFDPLLFVRDRMVGPNPNPPMMLPGN